MRDPTTKPHERTNRNETIGLFEILSEPITDQQFVRDALILFLGPAALMILLYLGTDPTTFEYDVAKPSLWGIYTSNLSHRSWRHLGSNLLGLFLIGGYTYALLTAVECRKHYVYVFVGSLLVFPLGGHLFLQFVLVHNPVFGTYEAVGFSEPIAALVGYLPLAIATYINRETGLRAPILTALLLYASGIAWAIGQIYGFDIFSVFLGGLGVIGVLWIALHISLTAELATKGDRLRYALSIVFFLLVYGYGLRTLFPGGNVGTMVGHLAGFLPGFFISIVVLSVFSTVRSNHELSLDVG